MMEGPNIQKPFDPGETLFVNHAFASLHFCTQPSFKLISMERSIKEMKQQLFKLTGRNSEPLRTTMIHVKTKKQESRRKATEVSTRSKARTLMTQMTESDRDRSGFQG